MVFIFITAVGKHTFFSFICGWESVNQLLSPALGVVEGSVTLVLTKPWQTIEN